MSGRTDRFALRVINELTDLWSADNYRFSDADRTLLDLLFTYIIEQHRHDGTAPVDSAPGVAGVELVSGGALPPGQTIYYRYTFVDGRGVETAPSNPSTIATPIQLDAPQAPSLAETTGTLRAGTYQYAISYTTGATNQETLLSTVAVIVLPASLGPNGGVTLTLPPAPINVGWNIYRCGPDERDWSFLTNTTTSPYTDDGSVAPDTLHAAPTANTTYLSNAVAITISESVPVGSTVRYYRSTSRNDWTTSFVTETATVPFTDIGAPTLPGGPPANVALIGSPPKLTVADETAEMLAPGLSIVPVTASFTLPPPR